MRESLFGSGLLESEAICGIDEAGRGPLAGPLVVAGVVLLEKIEGARDSKKLSVKRRGELFSTIIKNSKYHIVITDAEEIDAMGISSALKKSLLEITEHLKPARYLFDGNCNFGVSGITTLIGGDDLIEEISCASILAKVTRDTVMEELEKEFQNYSFSKHKGYGTALHLEEIRKFGLSSVHRKSYKIKSGTRGEKSLL